MSNVLFKCDSCSKNLSVNDTAVGRTFSCPACNNQVVVPEPEIIFNCPSCNVELSAPNSLMGKNFNCPSCENEFGVPRGEEME